MFIVKVNAQDYFDDDNDGFIYGLEYYDDEVDNFPIGCEWFRTEEERNNTIEEMKKEFPNIVIKE
jgi:hypothetical protein